MILWEFWLLLWNILGCWGAFVLVTLDYDIIIFCGIDLLFGLIALLLCDWKYLLLFALFVGEFAWRMFIGVFCWLSGSGGGDIILDLVCWLICWMEWLDCGGDWGCGIDLDICCCCCGINCCDWLVGETEVGIFFNFWGWTKDWFWFINWTLWMLD